MNSSNHHDDQPDIRDILIPALDFRTLETVLRYGTAEEIAAAYMWLEGNGRTEDPGNQED